MSTILHTAETALERLRLCRYCLCLQGFHRSVCSWKACFAPCTRLRSAVHLDSHRVPGMGSTNPCTFMRTKVGGIHSPVSEHLTSNTLC